MVDSWMQYHSTSQVIILENSSSTFRPSSSATMPARKLSPHAFEKWGPSRPILNSTMDDIRNFLSLPLPGVPAPHCNSHVIRKSRQELRALDEQELIIELVKDICNDLEISSICHKILHSVSILTHADRCSLFLVRGEKGNPDRCLVSQLFDVPCSSNMEQLQQKKEIRIPWSTGLVGYVAESRESVNIPDCYQEDLFNSRVSEKTDYTTYNMLCMPILDLDGEVKGVVQIINNRGGVEPFTDADEKVISQYLQFCGISLRNAERYERSELENKRNQVLLDLARMVFEEQSTIENVVYRIKTHTQSLLQCEKCQVLLVDENTKTFSRVFNLDVNDMNAQGAALRNSSLECHFPINIGITGYVSRTVEEGWRGFRHLSVPCMPIQNVSNKIVGVSKLINKLSGVPVNKNDEQLFEKCFVPSTHVYRLQELMFNDFSLGDEDMLKACLRMFMDLDLIERFHINYDALCRWLLSVRKGYAPATCHNWRHAFNVAQMMFAYLRITKLWQVFGEVETLSLLIACLCHDLDNRGTNSSFQIKSCCPLAQLYLTSTMKSPNFDQCIKILNSEGNQILSHLSPDEYSTVMHVLEDAISATDLAVYLRRRATFFRMVDTGTYNWKREDNRELLRAMLMTICDIATITKPWEIQRVYMMNREEKDELPLMQVRFIDSICAPIYKAFVKISDKLQPLLDGVMQNREQWLKLAEARNLCM